MKKTLIGILAVLGCIVLLTGCGKDKENEVENEEKGNKNIAQSVEEYGNTVVKEIEHDVTESIETDVENDNASDDETIINIAPAYDDYKVRKISNSVIEEIVIGEVKTTCEYKFKDGVCYEISLVNTFETEALAKATYESSANDEYLNKNFENRVLHGNKILTTASEAGLEQYKGYTIDTLYNELSAIEKYYL